MPDVLRALGMSRAQFTALGVISTNDYDRNVPSLGSATNFSVVKALKSTGMSASVEYSLFLYVYTSKCMLTRFFSVVYVCLLIDVRGIVQEYLDHPLVVQKNEDKTSFSMSIRVFVELRQQVLEVAPVQEALGDQTPYMELREEYNRLHDQYTKDQKEMQEMRYIRSLNYERVSSCHLTSWRRF